LAGQEQDIRPLGRVCQVRLRQRKDCIQVKTPTSEEILSLQFYCDDLDRTLTVREWFMEMVKRLWIEDEGFSGKRPFGNSGWRFDPAIAMVKAGWLAGSFSVQYGRDGKVHEYLEEFDDDVYDSLMDAAVASL
jgi:hypothetical protein